MNVPAAEYKSQTINEIIQSDQNKSVEIGKLKAKLEVAENELVCLKFDLSVNRLNKHIIIGRIQTILNHIKL